MGVCTALRTAKGADRKEVPPAETCVAGAPKAFKEGLDSLLLQDGGCRRLVGDQSIDQVPLQRRPYRRDLSSTEGRRDGQGLCGDLRWNAGETAVGSREDGVAVGIAAKAVQLAHGAQPHHFE